MMFGVLILTALLISIAVPVYSYTLEECALYDLPGTCSSAMNNKMYAAVTPIEVCETIADYIDCVELVGCECNLTLSYQLGSSLTYMHHFFEYQGCVSEMGQIDKPKGIPCDKWGNVTGSPDGQLLILSLSATPLVIALDKTCPGFKTCYEAYDTEGALAVHNRNLTQLCIALDRLVACLENAACGCNGGNDTDIVRSVLSEDRYFRQTCDLIGGNDMIPRHDVQCHANGTALVRTVCDVPDPSFKCVLDYEDELFKKGYTQEADCPATKIYIECVEDIACRCGLIEDWIIYRGLTNAIGYYRRIGCDSVSGSIIVVSGLRCPDGTGTAPDATSIVLNLAEHPNVEMQENWCKGVQKCYSDLDKSNGVALFEKNSQKVCMNSKIFVECMEMTFCQCGFYDYENTTNALKSFRKSHQLACFTDSVLREDFACRYGSIGFKCFDDSDCLVVKNSECKSTGMCDCKQTYMFTANNSSCTQVSGATIIGLYPGYGCVLILFVMLSTVP